MMRPMSRVAAVAAVAAATALVPGCSRDVPETGEALVRDRCDGCHPVSKVLAVDHDRQGWEEVVDDMVGRGAQATPEERERIVDYLSER